MADKRTTWAVTVERDGEPIVTIASNHLSGRELTPDDEETIRTAARSLLSFVGEEARQPKCFVCGGYGFVAQKRFIDDGYGEVDTCPACDPASLEDQPR
jgi:hypothetical protein